MEAVERLVGLAQTPVLVLARTIDSAPVVGVISGVSVEQELWGGYQVKFTHTQAQ